MAYTEVDVDNEFRPVGRPFKGRRQLGTYVSVETKIKIEELKERLGLTIPDVIELAINQLHRESPL